MTSKENPNFKIQIKDKFKLIINHVEDYSNTTNNLEEEGNLTIDINNPNSQELIQNSLTNKKNILNFRNFLDNPKKTYSSPFLQTVVSKINQTQESIGNDNSGSVGTICTTNFIERDESVSNRIEKISISDKNRFLQLSRSVMGTPQNLNKNFIEDATDSFLLDSLHTEVSLSPSNPGNGRNRINSTPILPSTNPNFPQHQQQMYFYPNQIELIDYQQHPNYSEQHTLFPSNFIKSQYNNLNQYINTNNIINNKTNLHEFDLARLGHAPANKYSDSNNTYSNTSTNPNSTSSSVKEDLHSKNIYSRKYSCNSVNDSNSVKLNNTINRNSHLNINSQIEMMNRKSFTHKETQEKEIGMKNPNNLQNNLNYFNQKNSHNLEKHKSNSHAHFKSTPKKTQSSPFKLENKNIQNYNINNSIFQNDYLPLENTPIMNIQIKTINGLKYFSLCRFDDLYSKIKSFCETHMLPEIYIDSIVNSISQALDSIFQLYNSSMTKNDVNYLNSLYVLWKDVKKREKSLRWGENHKESQCHLNEMDYEDVFSNSFDEMLFSEVNSNSLDEELNTVTTKYYHKFSRLNKSF